MVSEPSDVEDGDEARTQTGARQALIAAAGEHDLEEFATVPRYCDEDVLTQVIALAWRHQFDDNRVLFRRGIAELQAYVSGRIKLNIDGSRD